MHVKEIWNLKYNNTIIGLELGDINNNGQTELIAYTNTGEILVISLTGQILHKELILRNSPIWHLKVNDIDNDGNNELLLGGMDGYLETYKCDINYNLDLFWRHKFGSSISGILFDDINSDNLNEIIALSLDNTIRVLNSRNGDLIWGQVFEKGVGDAFIFSTDKKTKELGACGNDGTIRFFDGINGDLLWFKKYNDKIRCINFMNALNSTLIIFGGDDKKIHFIDNYTQEEIKVIRFNDFVWKCFSFPFQIHNKIIASSYSFAFFNNSTPLNNINFSSEMICLNDNLKVLWKLIGFNFETLEIIETEDKILILGGTTKGEIMIIDQMTGRILWEEEIDSCSNKIKFYPEKRFFFSCHDNGLIKAYNLI
ncbi:MAG: WD40 repeat domain-containing protein [Promethearchaeota archaeon]